MGVAWGEVALLQGEVALLRGGAVGTALPVPPPRVLLRQGQREEEVSLAFSLDQGMAASPLAYHAIGTESISYMYMYMYILCCHGNDMFIYTSSKFNISYTPWPNGVYVSYTPAKFICDLHCIPRAEK